MNDARDSDAGSFDPRTWQATKSGADAPTPPPRQPIEGTPPRATVAARANPMQRALLGSAAVLAIGAGAAWLSRPPRAAPVAAALATAQAPVAASPIRAPEPPPLARRALTLPDASRLAPALTASGIAPDEAKAALASIGPALAGRSGELRVVLSLDMKGATPRLERLEASFLDSSGAVVSRAADGAFATARVAASLTSVLHVVSGQMDNDSFYSSAVAAGVTDTLVPEIARALSFDFDFQQEIHAGDVFEIGYEQANNAAGTAVGLPKLMFVSLTTKAKSRTFYWYKPDGADGGWFDGNGASVVRSLMRTPVDGARITSKFGMRDHPIYFVPKLHKGVDFGAPIGSPIYAAGNGVVEIATPSSSAGNWLWLKHDNGWETVYMHMNRYLPGAHVGDRVTQGQQIGEVGTTGHSTGPHLHYEVHIGGQPVDPLSIQTSSTQTLSGATRAAFIKERDRIDVARNLQAR